MPADADRFAFGDNWILASNMQDAVLIDLAVRAKPNFDVLFLETGYHFPDPVDDFWVYDKGLADFSVKTQRELGLVGNGPDDTLGNMEEDRIQTVIDQIRDDAKLDVPKDLVASDLFTNEFIDPNIGL